MDLTCPQCGTTLSFDQPYRYHAGFANQGFLYDDAGTMTLIWSSFDPAWEHLAGQRHPWTLSAADWAEIEPRLAPAPSGGRWRSNNPARCRSCHAGLSKPMVAGEIYSLVYPESVNLDAGPSARHFASVVVLRDAAT